MALGIALILAALFLLLFNQREARQAEQSVTQIMPQALEQIEKRQTGETVIPDPLDPTMTEVEIDGYYYVGILSIPSLDLALPVMSEWSYERLRIAPCRYAGSCKTDDLVIAAHNYPSHFGTLSQLTGGETVYFTDMDGMVYTYTVTVVDVLSPSAVEDMTSGDYDLTLFTCTYGGASRVTVRCDRVEGAG